MLLVAAARAAPERNLRDAGAGFEELFNAPGEAAVAAGPAACANIPAGAGSGEWPEEWISRFSR